MNMDATTMQQQVSDTTPASEPVNGLASDMDNVNISAETVTTTTAAPVPTYDQQFPSLGGGSGPGAGSDASTPAPFGRWNAKPRVQSSTITQVNNFCRKCQHCVN